MGILYRSLRIGKGGKHFHLHKFRTMHEWGDGGSPTASSDDRRLTPIGRWLRRFKLDELPTLFNLLNGTITVVGPRPDVPAEIAGLDERTRTVVLSVKPGLISPATLWNINEDEALKGEKDPHQAYLTRIKPTKYRLNVWYVENRSFMLDLKVMLAAALKLLRLPIRINVFPSHLVDK